MTPCVTVEAVILHQRDCRANSRPGMADGSAEPLPGSVPEPAGLNTSSWADEMVRTFRVLAHLPAPRQCRALPIKHTRQALAAADFGGGRVAAAQRYAWWCRVQLALASVSLFFCLHVSGRSVFCSGGRRQSLYPFDRRYHPSPPAPRPNADNRGGSFALAG